MVYVITTRLVWDLEIVSWESLITSIKTRDYIDTGYQSFDPMSEGAIFGIKHVYIYHFSRKQYNCPK